MEKENFIILDTETTGLDNDDEVIELSIVNQDNQILLNERFKPLKNEFKKFNNTMIDINGKKFNDQDIIDDLTLGTSSDYIDAQWLKKNIAMQTLPNGLCSLPVVQGGCPHANACLTCPNFRTDRTFLPQHKEQLQRTEVVIETCQKNGWVRQLEMNERIKESLVKIITPLEDN